MKRELEAKLYWTRCSLYMLYLETLKCTLTTHTHTQALNHTFNQSAVGKYFNYLSVIELSQPGTYITYIVGWASGTQGSLSDMHNNVCSNNNITQLLS